MLLLHCMPLHHACRVFPLGLNRAIFDLNATSSKHMNASKAERCRHLFLVCNTTFTFVTLFESEAKLAIHEARDKQVITLKALKFLQ